MRSKPNSTSVPRPIAAPLLLAISICSTVALSGCATTGSTRVLPRALPPPPAFAAPVSVARPAAGTPLLEVAKREQNGRLEANRRLVKFGQWYEGVRRAYAGGAP